MADMTLRLGGGALRIDDDVLRRAFECIAPGGQPATCAAAMHLLEVRLPVQSARVTQGVPYMHHHVSAQATAPRCPLALPYRRARALCHGCSAEDVRDSDVAEIFYEPTCTSLLSS